MNEHAKTIESFYRAFQERDHVGMAACYHADVQFSDPVFTDLGGGEVRAMWHMLCERGTDLRVDFSDVSAADDRGSAHWEAHYTFGPTGRLVHNVVDASFVFRDGKIAEHVDHFDLWRWTRQALGSLGVVTGWTGLARGKVQEAADGQLRRFIEEHPEYADSG